MFCKWCGGKLAPSDSKCKRCGREVPALSDCGGFYDLVPNARNNVEAQIGSSELTQRAVNPPYPSVELQTNAKNSDKNLLLGLSVSVAVVCILLIAMIVALTKINLCYAKINELRNDLNIMNEKIDWLTAPTEPIDGNPTEVEPEEIESENGEPDETETEKLEPKEIEPDKIEPDTVESDEAESDETESVDNKSEENESQEIESESEEPESEEVDETESEEVKS